MDRGEGDEVKSLFREWQGPCSARREVLGEGPGNKAEYWESGLRRVMWCAECCITELGLCWRDSGRQMKGLSKRVTLTRILP